jgi:hypothetical protein
VGLLAANEKDMENACNPDVVDKLSFAAQKRRVLDPVEAVRLMPHWSSCHRFIGPVCALACVRKLTLLLKFGALH